MFAHTQSHPSSHTGSGSGRKQKQGRRRERVDPGGEDRQQTPSHGLSLADMEGVLGLTSHAAHDTTAGHMTSHDTAGHMTQYDSRAGYTQK